MSLTQNATKKAVSYYPMQSSWRFFYLVRMLLQPNDYIRCETVQFRCTPLSNVCSLECFYEVSIGRAATVAGDWAKSRVILELHKRKLDSWRVTLLIPYLGHSTPNSHLAIPCCMVAVMTCHPTWHNWSCNPQFLLLMNIWCVQMSVCLMAIINWMQRWIWLGIVQYAWCGNLSVHLLLKCLSRPMNVVFATSC